MATPRREVLADDSSIYHCISRCVRRAFLCGFDKYTGKDFNHRQQWVQDRIEKLSHIFLINILDFALMSNHLHIMIRTSPEELSALDDKNILERWRMLYPKKYDSEEQKKLETELTLNDVERMSELRKRLGSVSWFMKSLNEFIARKANKEDGCTGRFWEGRFKCQRLIGMAATLACSIYINLNPIRAKITKTPETSEFTSAYLRILELKSPLLNSSSWLTPIDSTTTSNGYLPISFTEYLELLEETGRSLVAGKRGVISSEFQPILIRLGLEPTFWDQTSSQLSQWFSCIIGNPESIKHQANQLGKAWLKGYRNARQAFC